MASPPTYEEIFHPQALPTPKPTYQETFRPRVEPMPRPTYEEILSFHRPQAEPTPSSAYEEIFRPRAEPTPNSTPKPSKLARLKEVTAPWRRDIAKCLAVILFVAVVIAGMVLIGYAAEQEYRKGRSQAHHIDGLPFRH